MNLSVLLKKCLKKNQDVGPEITNPAFKDFVHFLGIFHRSLIDNFAYAILKEPKLIIKARISDCFFFSR